jgi:hypothetical protein
LVGEEIFQGSVMGGDWDTSLDGELESRCVSGDGFDCFDGEHDHGRYEFQNSVDSDAEDSEREQDDPDNWVKNECRQG